MSQPFDFEKALTELQAGKDLTGKDGALMPLIKQLTEAGHLSRTGSSPDSEDATNRKNGTSSGIIETSSASFEPNAPRDRAGTLQLQPIKQHQTQLTSEIDRKMISLFSHGMNYRDIQYPTQDLYGINVSTGALITNQRLPTLKQWQQRPLHSTYPVGWMPCIIK